MKTNARGTVANCEMGLARSKVCGLAWAHPALSGGKVYLRDEKNLICIPLE